MWLAGLNKCQKRLKLLVSTCDIVYMNNAQNQTSAVAPAFCRKGTGSCNVGVIAEVLQKEFSCEKKYIFIQSN